MVALSERSSDVTLGHIYAPGRGQLRILVADHDRTSQIVIAKVLERAGHETEIVVDGEQALDSLEASSFDLALMDITMPVMSGIEAAKLYRFIALGERRMPILALTSDAAPATAARCAEAGMDGCVTKPVDPLRLLELINEVVLSQERTLGSAIAASEQVVDIASHRRFQAASEATLDRRRLADLEALGGRSFVGDLIGDFVADAEGLVEELARSAEASDIRSFRAQTHALKIAAAEVGAKALCDLCADVRKIRPLEPVRQGLVNRLAQEFDLLRQTLQHWVTRDRTCARVQPFTSESDDSYAAPNRSALPFPRTISD